MCNKKGIVSLALCAVLTAAGTLPASASTTQEQLESARAQNVQTQSQLASVQDRIAEIESKKGKAESYLTEVNTQITELMGQLDELHGKYAVKQNELDLVTRDLKSAQREEQNQREDMALRIQYMYENSLNAGLLEAVFSSDNFSEILNRATNMSELTEYDRKMLEQYMALCDQIEEKQIQVTHEQEEIKALEEQSEEKKEELQLVYESTREEVEQYVASLTGAQSAEAELIAAIQEQEATIQALNIQAAEEVRAAEAAAAMARAAQEAQAVQPTQDTTAAYTEVSAPAEGEQAAPADQSTAATAAEKTQGSSWDGEVINPSAGTVVGPSGQETYYNLDMSGVVQIMRSMGNNDAYWVRDDGVKMLGDYVMVAADLSIRPRGSVVDTSLGPGIVCDTGGFIFTNPTQLDIAVSW